MNLEDCIMNIARRRVRDQIADLVLSIVVDHHLQGWARVRHRMWNRMWLSVRDRIKREPLK